MKESYSPQRHEEHKESQSSFVSDQNLEKQNPISKIIVDCAFKVHSTIGPGLMESAYQECMMKELLRRNIPFKAEFQMPIWYEGELLNTPYRVDFLVDNCIIVELKSVERLLAIHEAQTLTYLKLSKHKMALLINFSTPLIKDGIKRFVI